MIDANLIRSFGVRTAQEEVDGVLGFLANWIKKNRDERSFFKFGKFWGGEGLQRTHKWMEARDILTGLGFTVYHYEDVHEYGDGVPSDSKNNGPFTVISW